TKDGIIFERLLEIEPNKNPMKLLVCDLPPGATKSPVNYTGALIFEEKQNQAFGIATPAGGPAKLSVGKDNSSVELDVPPHAERVSVWIYLWRGAKEYQKNIAVLGLLGPPPLFLEKFIKPGPSQWTAPITTKGHVEKDDAPYVIDTLTVPYK